MNRIALTLLATAALAATSARADTRFSVGFGVGAPACRPEMPVVVTNPPPAVIYAPAPVGGYWKEVLVKTWVPERWVVSRDRWGRSVRILEPGYTTFRTERVWVDRHTGPRFPGNTYDHHRSHSDGNERMRSDWHR